MQNLETFTEEIEDLAGLLLDNNRLDRRELAADNIRFALHKGLLEVDQPTRIKAISREAGRSGLSNSLELAVS